MSGLQLLALRVMLPMAFLLLPFPSPRFSPVRRKMLQMPSWSLSMVPHFPVSASALNAKALRVNVYFRQVRAWRPPISASAILKGEIFDRHGRLYGIPHGSLLRRPDPYP